MSFASKLNARRPTQVTQEPLQDQHRLLRWRRWIGPAIGLVLVVGVSTMPYRSNANSRRLAVLIPGEVEFFTVLRTAMKRKADELDIEVRVYDADWDVRTQQKQFENAKRAGFGMIALCAVHQDAFANLDTISGSKLFTFVNSLGTSPTGAYPGVVTHIGRNEVQAGRLLAELTRIAAGDNQNEISIGLVEGCPGTTPQIQRHQGFMEIAAAHPNWKIKWVHRIPNWSELELLKRTRQTDLDQVDIVATQWALATDALIRARGPRLPEFVTLQCTPATVKSLANGRVAAATQIETRREGELVAEVARRLLDDQDVDAFHETVHSKVLP